MYTWIVVHCQLRVHRLASISQAILIKRNSKHYRHNVKSPYGYFMDQNGVHGYWNNKVFYCHWPSTSDIKALVF